MRCSDHTEPWLELERGEAMRRVQKRMHPNLFEPFHLCEIEPILEHLAF